MMRVAYRLLLATVLFAAVGCVDRSTGGGMEQEEPGAAESTANDERSEVEDEGQSLRTIMQELSANVAGFSRALWLEDLTGMAERAAAIADHEQMSPGERERIQATLGPEMGAFAEADEEVHLASVRLREAVEAENLDAVLDELGALQRGCVSCHTRFRDSLRSDP